jgi:hypothetical protein
VVIELGYVECEVNAHCCLSFYVVGVIYVLGRKEYGRLGLGEDCDDAKELIPIPALKDKKCVDISCGETVSFAVTDRGEYKNKDKPNIKSFKPRHCLKCSFTNVQYTVFIS